MTGKILNTRPFSYLKISQEDLRTLLKITDDHSEYNILEWDGGNWKVYTSLRDDKEPGRAVPDDLACFSIKHLSKEISFYGNDSEGNINEIHIKVYKNNKAGDSDNTQGMSGIDSDAEYQKYADRLKAVRGETLDLSNVMTYEGYQLYFEESISSVTLEKNGDVTLSLTGDLAERYGESYQIDSNVIKIYALHMGNGSTGQILFLKEDGTVDALIDNSLSTTGADTLHLEKKLASAEHIEDIVSVWGMLYAYDVEGREIEISTALIEAEDKIQSK